MVLSISLLLALNEFSLSEGTLAVLLSFVLWTFPLFGNIDEIGEFPRSFMILFGCAVLAFPLGQSLVILSHYARFLSLFCYFHFSEFLYISISHSNCRFDSLLLNHGAQYAAAFSLSLIEHHLSNVEVPDVIKEFGLYLSLIGLFIRALALLTAREAFTHIISSKKIPSHKLVQNGIYAYMRHPGYCGWLVWVTSSQVMAGNPICGFIFCVVTWFFFKERIEYEEALLVNMFGESYIEYRSRVRFSGIPFIE